MASSLGNTVYNKRGGAKQVGHSGAGGVRVSSMYHGYNNDKHSVVTPINKPKMIKRKSPSTK